MNPTIAAKAILAALIALVGALATAATDGGISLSEWLVAVGALLTSLGGVYLVPNSGGQLSESDDADPTDHPSPH